MINLILVILESLAKIILKVVKLLIVDPIQKIEIFLIDTKREIRKELRSDVSRWVIACIICALLVGYLTHLNSSFYENNTDNVQSFLSSISQGLAALFALAFTISIFGAQTMGGFTALDKVMDRWAKVYMVLFSVGIIFPLWQLITEIYSIDLFSLIPKMSIALPLQQLKIGSVGNIDLLTLDIILVSFCVLGIIPFTIKINRIIKYEGGIPDSYSKARDAIISGNEVISSDNISKLGRLGYSALKDALPDKVMFSTTAIRNLGNLSIKNNLEGSTAQVIVELDKLGLKAMDQKTEIGDYKVPWVVMHHYIFLPEYPIAWNLTNGFREICIGSIDRNFDEATVSFSCDALFDIGYMYIQKIRTTFLKTISRNLRMVLPNQLSLLEGDWSNSKTPTLVEMLLEIAEKATKKKEPLFCWNDITERNYQEKDLDNLNKFFKEDMQTSFKARHMRKTDNGKTIMLFGDRSNYSFELKGENEQAILTHQFYNNAGFAEKEPECVKVLPICYKDNKIYICKFKYNETLKHSLIYLWIIGTYTMNNYPDGVTDDIVRQIKRSENEDIRSIFESEYIQQETSDFALTSDRRDDFEDIVDYIKKFQEFYFGFEEYLQHKQD
ncbi:hypothetical protein RG963_00310 [Methanosarcina sp. Z-7115]|uniref:Uncharacterized protein n=1 Tax=Methanosarcina baikalica TaxID=3073890 RepID=A0ABU2CWX6_9EURY|nr:hypothetical protein [Methanosarcina sp. Z-7115]MDR7664247.1 hypothetical protein [Methanosarcina sp. Z-7115]